MAAQRSAIAESHYSCSLLGALDVQFKNITASLEQHVLPPNQNPISHLKRRLQSLQQGNKTCTEYLNQAKSWADELSAVGKPVEDDDLISLVINGINPTYNSFVTAFILRDRETIFHDFQSELLSHEILLQNQQQALNPEVGSFALRAHRSCPPHSPIAFRNSPNTFHKPRFVPRPLGQFRHSSPHNSYHTPSFSPRNSPPPQSHNSSANHNPSSAAPPPR